MTDFALPALDGPCPDCTTDEAQARMAADYERWSAKEAAAYEAFAASYPNQWDAQEAWKQTAAHRELIAEQPIPPGVGCVECDFTKVHMTPAGSEVLAFLHRHGR